ncbi:MAG: hypothetical protein ACTH7R_10640 [Corynebacterium flavescens]|uniref:hypothetical protein n=1 Tax=Corynebacterium flavescens TaxID=28028 RepID=UPI003F93680D
MRWPLTANTALEEAEAIMMRDAQELLDGLDKRIEANQKQLDEIQEMITEMSTILGT